MQFLYLCDFDYDMTFMTLIICTAIIQAPLRPRLEGFSVVIFSIIHSIYVLHLALFLLLMR